MNTLILQPTDVLFFRDGRPIEGSLAGHGSAWPLPHVTDAALHAALHRSGLGDDSHIHRNGHGGAYQDERTRKFGSLATAGPFPVKILKTSGPKKEEWYFPRPADLGCAEFTPSLAPAELSEGHESSLPHPLQFPIGSRKAPSKDDAPKNWITASDYSAYLAGTGVEKKFIGVNDDDFSDSEHMVGIAIDPETQTTGQGSAAGQIYSARYLRLRSEWSMGLFAKAEDKGSGGNSGTQDIVRDLFAGATSHHILVGGQQRACTAVLHGSPGTPLPLPRGKEGDFTHTQIDGRDAWLVKWVLLAPAIWPYMPLGDSKRGSSRREHPGGSLPSWISEEDGSVLLTVVSAEERRRRRGLNYRGAGYQSGENAAAIAARLVAALVPKPVVVTGWALADEAAGRSVGGAKPTHLAVPAGAVYYFAADSEEAAATLAKALNWHGTGEQACATIRNRRSTLLGEKGYGIGVCGSWDFVNRTSTDVSK